MDSASPDVAHTATLSHAPLFPLRRRASARRLYRTIGRIVLIEFSQKVLLSALAGVFLGHALPLFFGWEPRKPAWPLGRSATWAALVCASLGFGLRAVIVLLQRASLPLTGWLLFFEEEMSAELGLSDWLNPLICTMVAGERSSGRVESGSALKPSLPPAVLLLTRVC